MKILDEERVKNIVDMDALDEALEDIHKGIDGESQHIRTRPQRIHNAHRKVHSLDLVLGDNVMIHADEKRSDRLQGK